MQTVFVTLVLVAAALAAPAPQQPLQPEARSLESKPEARSLEPKPEARSLEQKPEPIAIVKLASDVQPDGSFTYEYETANGIKADARGILNNAGSENEALAVQGSFSFVAPDDGQTYTVTYIADQNGFQPQGAHLPVPPPIPEDIQRALEYIAAHPEENGEEAKQN